MGELLSGAGGRQFGWRRLAEQRQGMVQQRSTRVGVFRQGRRQILLGELLAIVGRDQWQVRQAGHRQVERGLQQALPGAVVEQIEPAHDVGDALLGIIHHHGQLIGPQAIASLEHHIAERGEIQLDRALQAVLPASDGPSAAEALCRTHIQPPGMLALGRFGSLTAPAGVDGVLAPLLARAITRVGDTTGLQLLECLGVGGVTLALIAELAIALQAEGIQLAQDVIGAPGGAAPP